MTRQRDAHSHRARRSVMGAQHVTLILGLMTQQYVLVVSDLRTVMPKADGSYQLDDDDRNKLAILGTSAVFGYTGVADINGVRTHEWFIEVMKPFVDNGNVSEGLRQLRSRLTREFKRPRLRRLAPDARRHAFIGLGFKRRASTGSMFAATDIISNFHDRLGRAHSVAQDEFTLLSTQLKPGAAPSLLGIGWVPIEHGRQTELQRYLRRRLFLNEPAHAARLLGQEIRRVSATLGPEGAVGKGLLACCISRAYVLHGGIPGGGIDLQTLGAATSRRPASSRCRCSPRWPSRDSPCCWARFASRSPRPSTARILITNGGTSCHCRTSAPIDSCPSDWSACARRAWRR